jgi:hypothetical protein
MNIPTAINVNNLIEIRKTGLQALRETLGPVGMVRFIQQYGGGKSTFSVNTDYTENANPYELAAYNFGGGPPVGFPTVPQIPILNGYPDWWK